MVRCFTRASIVLYIKEHANQIKNRRTCFLSTIVDKCAQTIASISPPPSIVNVPGHDCAYRNFILKLLSLPTQTSLILIEVPPFNLPNEFSVTSQKANFASYDKDSISVSSQSLFFTILFYEEFNLASVWVAAFCN